MSVKYSAISADIKAQLETIPGTGIVHQYERQSSNLAKFLELFKAPDGKILGWEITRKAVPAQYAGVINRHHQMIIQGYRAYHEESNSSIEFQDLCDDISDHFCSAAPLSGTWEYTNTLEPEKTPSQILLINDRMFGGVLCHCGIITISVNDRIII